MFEKLFRKKPKDVPVTVPVETGGYYRPLLTLVGMSKNSWIPPMLDSSDMGIRTEEELYQRLIALWAVVGTASTDETYFRDYIVNNGMTDWLTEREKNFLI
jgi:hypothetical protein